VIACLSVFCGHCSYCLTGRTHLCQSRPARTPQEPPKLSWKGAPADQRANLSAYAEQMLVHENGETRVLAHPRALPAELRRRLLLHRRVSPLPVRARAHTAGAAEAQLEGRAGEPVRESLRLRRADAGPRERRDSRTGSPARPSSWASAAPAECARAATGRGE